MDFQLPDAGWTPNLLMFGFVICFGIALPLGMQVSVINAPAKHIQRWCDEVLSTRFNTTLTPDEMEILWASVVTASVLMGMIGCFSGGSISTKLGRMASSIELLYMGRITVGLALGLALTSIPMYLAEVSPLKQRGAMGVLLPVGVTAGVVLGQIVTMEQLLGSESLWHYGLGVGGFLGLIGLVFYCWMPESPEYLYSIKHQPEEALKVVRKLFGNNSIDETFEKRIRLGKQTLQKPDTFSLKKVFVDSKYRLPLALLFFMNAGCGLSGVNAIFSYSVSTLERIGISSSDATLISIGYGCINLAASSCGLFLMDRFNRRPMMLISCIGCGITLLINTLAIYFVDYANWFAMISVGAIVAFLLFYQAGIGQIPFFIGAELFDIGPRSSALSLGSFGSWSANLIMVMLFPIVQQLWGAFAFLPSSIVCFALAIFVYFYLPETRASNISDISQLISRGFKSKIR
ncbi:solute carrier family 2, facilitated glucose transporter member 1-like isoform X2 [Armigeres subalbatus]|uniref:solute carrier family 2, facilitated glucose transporter member 1-like isoform X2 n=1 Tax=Armigeres subalbatus TaxID=124917 RepID=UPI002ED3E528